MSAPRTEVILSYFSKNDDRTINIKRAVHEDVADYLPALLGEMRNFLQSIGYTYVTELVANTKGEAGTVSHTSGL